MMTVGELLRLAKDLHEMRAPMGAQLLLLDPECLAGAEPLVVLPPGEPSGDLTHLLPDVQAGALLLRVARRTRIISPAGVLQ
jgi:hypothetical protein